MAINKGSKIIIYHYNDLYNGIFKGGLKQMKKSSCSTEWLNNEINKGNPTKRKSVNKGRIINHYND